MADLIVMARVSIGQSCIVGMNPIVNVVRCHGKIKVTRVSATIVGVTWQNIAMIIQNQC